jgi:hypothetical protein
MQREMHDEFGNAFGAPMNTSAYPSPVDIHGFGAGQANDQGPQRGKSIGSRVPFGCRKITSD